MSTTKKEKYNGMDVFTAISLCSGYEGLGLGLKRAIPNIRTICYVENEAYAIANLVAKIKEKRLDDAPIWDDLKTFDPKPFTGLVDIIHSGFPCQPFSIAGNRQGTDDPRHLWPHIARIIEAVRPIWCVFENVPGHLSLGFPDVYCSLQNMGYKVEAGLFTAAEVGAPHRRQRLFILASSSDRTMGKSSIVEPTQKRTCQTDSQERTEPYRAGQLAHSESMGHRRGSRNICKRTGKIQNDTEKEQSGIRGETLRFSSGQLADTESGRAGGQITERESFGEKTPGGRLVDCRWPARPGQPQYEWEEPRVVADTARIHGSGAGWEEIRRRWGVCKTSKGINAFFKQHGIDCEGPIEEDGETRWHIGNYCVNDKGLCELILETIEEWQAQSGVGRAVNGSARRVDRLRLLGNGVMPQQAEKAIRELSKLYKRTE